jgi:hypothetical protein
MSAVPAHSFITPWSPLSCRCKVEVGGRAYDVVRWTAPVRIVRYTARQNGTVVAERGAFPALLRDLAKITAERQAATDG